VGPVEAWRSEALRGEQKHAEKRVALTTATAAEAAGDWAGNT